NPTALRSKAGERQAAYLRSKCALPLGCYVTADWRQAEQPASVTINVVQVLCFGWFAFCVL
ncbi:hypothetical protein AB9K35_00295, partial [Leisingera sp. XS_AS12]|uniref:hypothetical protein n=1 Tax=Leisingera sp. XS_AS12 TaxID=3241294 RepID=UPI003516D666